MKEISMPVDYSLCPSGRFPSDGPYSGERFREQWLLPFLTDGELVVDLDGVLSYGDGFLEEAFGGLIKRGLEFPTVISRLHLKSKDPKLTSRVLDLITASV